MGLLARNVAFAAIASGVAVAFACGPGDLSDLTRGSGADTGAPSPTPDGASPFCVSAGVPPPPPKNDGTTIGLVVLVVSDVRIDDGSIDTDSGLPPSFGLDIDRNCGCPGETPSCVPLDDSVMVTCDIDGGRDNVAASKLGQLSSIVEGLRPEVLGRRIRNGAATMVLQLQGWNGLPNDDAVTVNMLNSPGTPLDRDGDPIKPRFDGNDVWDVDTTTTLDGEGRVGESCADGKCLGMNALTVNAYVTDGLLVAPLPSITLSLSVDATSRLELPYKSPILMGRLTQDDGTGIRRITGEIVGRLPVDDVLRATTVLRFPSPDGGADVPLCPSNQQFYVAYKEGLCAAADVAESAENDNKGARCGAISSAVTFAASSAKLGVLRKPTTTNSLCGDASDSCFQ